MQDSSRVADGPSETQDPDPGVAIDLTDELLEAGAPLPTNPKDTGRTDPQAQEGGEQQVGHQPPSLHVGRVTPDHWEDKLEKSGGDPPEGWAEARSESPSEQGDETEFEF